ncbi:MAG: hypothetical protein GF353_20335 [Candidatus Lokiarchaeota archaeon]|nr:hypothetical protein [Candidatus Lokiarchaeota archaeon]
MITNILILSISFTLLILTGIIFQKSRKYHTNIKFLMASLITISIANTAVGLNLGNLIFMIIITSLLPLGVLFLFFHYEQISYPRPRLKFLIFLLALYLFSLSFKLIIPLYMVLKGISFNLDIVNLRQHNDIFIYTLFRMSNFLKSLIILIVFTLALSTMLKEIKIIKLRAIQIESIGLIFLFIYGFLYFIRDLFFYDSYYDILTFTALLFSLVGLLLIISNFIMHPDYLYLIPLPIFNFMIFNQGGSPCYIRKVKNLDKEEPTRDLEHLMAGAFTAVSTMFKEVLGAGANIRYIDADNFIILVTSLPDKKGVLVVITGGETALFKNSLVRFAHTWPPQLLNKINEIVDLNEVRPKIDELIKSSFPYVVFSQINKTN